MNKDKRSRFLTAIFASAMLCVSPVYAEDEVDNESTLNSYLTDSVERTIILKNDITLSSYENIILGEYKTLRGKPTYSTTGDPKTLSGPNIGAFLHVNKGLSIESLNVTQAQIINEIGSTVQLTQSKFERCAWSSSSYTIHTLDDKGGAIHNKGGKIESSHNSFEWNLVQDSGGAIYNAAGGVIEISEGDIYSNNFAEKDGGAIYNEGTLKIIANSSETVKFESNNARERGGAIYNKENTGSLDISGVTFESNYANEGGGAIWTKGNAIIKNSTFNENYTAVGIPNGGAIYNEINGELEIEDSFFEKNYVRGGDDSQGGGAIFNRGTAKLTAKNSGFVFRENEVQEAYGEQGNGGAILNKWTLTLNAENGKRFLFEKNKAKKGGAIFNEGTATISNAKFENNISDEFGGAIYTSRTLNVTGGEFINNTSDEYGGAIFSKGTSTISGVKFIINTSDKYGGAIFSKGTSTISGVEFISNTATDRGGAIYNESDSTIKILNSDFLGNKTTSTSLGQGGAIYNLGADSVVNIVDSSFLSNEAEDGGAIYNRGKLTITAKDNEIDFMDNRATNGGAIYNECGSRGDANIYIVAEGEDIRFFNNNNLSSNGNGIYNEANGTRKANIYLNAKDGKEIRIDDTIDGGFTNVDNQIININDQTHNPSAPTGGTIGFYNKIKNNIVNIFNGKVNINGSQYIDSTAKINLNGGTLNIKSGDITYNGINIGSGAIFNHDLIGGGDSQTLNGGNIQFTGSGATAKIYSSDGTYRDISLSAINSSTGSNTIHIDGANVNLSENNYLGDTIYEFTNSQITLNGGGTYEFDNLKVSENTKLGFNLDIIRDDVNGNTITTDTLKVNNINGDTQIFDIGTIRIHGEENGQRGEYIASNNLLEGKAELKDSLSSPTFSGATTSWIYKISRDGSQKIKLEIEDYSNSYTLNDMNVTSGKRFFQFSDGDTRDYHVGSFLGTTAEGEFFVSGNNRNVISGEYTDFTGATQRASLFKLDNNTKLTIDNVTIQDANLVANVNNADAELKINNSTISSNGNIASGAITVEKGKANIVGSAFNNNGHYNLSKGGAIFNQQEGTVNVSNTTFTGNKSKIGGAITNEGNLTISDGTSFSSNIATETVGGGGAIYNVSSGNVLISSSTFSGNEARNTVGGAIYNKGALNVIGSIFNDNIAGNADGGAIYNEANTEVKILGSEFNGNNTKGLGGAIYNKGTLLEISNTIFTDNSADYISGQGGAIYSQTGNLNVLNGTFTGNHSEQLGGAIALESNATISNSSFDGNFTLLQGGAIFVKSRNEDVTVNIIDTSFTNNYTTDPNIGMGGAIYNGDGRSSGTSYKSTVNILAQNSDVIFEGNKVKTDGTAESNALYNCSQSGNGAEINLNANGDKKIKIADGVDGLNLHVDKQVININKANGSALPTDGTIEFDNTVKNNTVNLYDGVLAFGENNGTFGSFDSSVVFNVNGGSIDLANDTIQNVNLGNMTLNNDLKMSIDGDFSTKELDTITADSFTANGNIINIERINLLAPTEDRQFEISPLGTFADDAVKNAVAQAIQYTGGDIVYSPIYQYRVTYDPTTAMLRFGMGGNNPSENFNPAVLSAPVGTQLGAYLNQVNVYEQAFSNMDMMMIMPKAQRNAMKFANKYASSQGAGNGGVITFSPNQIPEQNRGLWFRPYTTFENVGLSKGPNVKNIAYGSLVGGDTGIIELKRGWDMVASVYGAYNGSNQNYDGITMIQNGGSLGVSGVWYKGNFFSGLTANVGANSGEANSMYGKDHFTTLATGVASKTGYNFELANGKFIIQPNYLMSYSFVNTFDYTNAAGVKISSDPLNAIQIAPGVKLIGNLKNGWQPYLGVQMVWNIMDRTRFKANNVELPNMSVDPYIQYGAGVQKKVGDRFTGFGQAMMRNGGRNGIALQFGFRWSL